MCVCIYAKAALALLFKRLSDGSTSMRPLALPNRAGQIHAQLAAASDTSVFDGIITLLSSGAPNMGLMPHPEAALQMFASIVDTGHPVPQSTLSAFASDIEKEVLFIGPKSILLSCVLLPLLDTCTRLEQQHLHSTVLPCWLRLAVPRLLQSFFETDKQLASHLSKEKNDPPARFS